MTYFSLKSKIQNSFRNKILLGLFIIFVITFSIFTSGNVTQQRKLITESTFDLLHDGAKLTAKGIVENINNNLQILEIISQSDLIYEFANQVYNNNTLQTLFNELPDANKTSGVFYIPYLKNNKLYQEILYNFNKMTSSIENLALVRIFAPDGNVIVGSAYGQEDIKDYKGDKGWFKKEIGSSIEYDINETQISAISRARRMNNVPAIRYIKALSNDGDIRHGVLVINFSAEQIIKSINSGEIGTNGHFEMVDLNYVNAEGQNIGEVYLGNGYDESSTFNESNAGNIVLKSELFNLDDSMMDDMRVEYEYNSTSFLASYHKVGNFGHDWVVLAVMSFEDFNVNIRKSNNFQIVSQLITFILVMIAVSIIIHKNFKTIDELVEGTKKVANGDLLVEIEVKTKDELGQLSDNFNNMVRSLRKIIGTTVSTSSILKSNAEELQSATEEMNASAEQVSSTSQAMSDGATSQTELISDINDRIIELQSIVTDIIKKIQVNTQEVSQIALQTNILALNAGIEASRAGDYGRGFAVVAENVRKLSDQSKMASERIDSVADEIRQTLMVSFNDISQTMINIVSVSEETAASAEEVAAAAEEMNATIEEISSSAVELTNRADGTLQSVKKFNINK